MGVDPDNEWKVEYEIIPEKEKVIKELKKAAKNVDHIYLATDLDREGEAIAWHLKEALGSNKYKYSRVRFNQITKSSILESFADPKEIDINLVEAQQARRCCQKLDPARSQAMLWEPRCKLSGRGSESPKQCSGNRGASYPVGVPGVLGSALGPTVQAIR